jgi:flagellar M-ring protein FliF
MVRLAKGRQLSDSQVTAIANLVASSVSGLPVDNVRIVDQSGRLLSDARGDDTSGLELQAEMEEKLRAQISQLLAPVLGPDNFSSEIQVELDLEARTSARESYDKQGVVREETQETTRSAGTFGGFGVPGALSNTPPAPGTVQQGAGPAAMRAPTPPAGETRASRTYELGREVAVTNVAPGSIKRISVAVALSAEAMKSGKASDIEKIKALVSAAVGAVPERGDRVEVIVRTFADTAIEAPAFYETGWFAMIVRYVAALIGVLLILLLGVRPLLRALRGRGGRDGGAAVDRVLGNSGGTTAGERVPDAIDRSLLNRQVGAAQKVVEDRPDRAVIAIRQMLTQNP